MRKDDLSKIISKYWNIIKILGTFLAIIAMIIAIRTYINYTTIQDAIIKVNMDIENAKEEIDYTNKFLKKYLDSDFADYFLAHKNNILFQWEYIIKFDAPQKKLQQKNKKKQNENIIDSPQKSRKHFIKAKINS